MRRVSGRQLPLPFGTRGAPPPPRADDVPFELDPPPPARPAPDRAIPPRAVMFAQARAVAEQLSGALGCPVRLSVTDNRSTMVSFRRRAGAIAIRLHHMFLAAPPPVLEAVAQFVSRRSADAGRVLDDYVMSCNHRIRRDPPARRNTAPRPRGRVYDLQAIFDRLNAEHFGGAIDARIGWGRDATGRRSIRLGVYDHLTRCIRIHPALDRPEVPAFFVDFIVFHEMLHQAVPAKRGAARRSHHSREFRRLERSFPLYQQAVAWERLNLPLLLHRFRG
jgi:hypothetical protein